MHLLFAAAMLLQDGPTDEIRAIRKKLIEAEGVVSPLITESIAPQDKTAEEMFTVRVCKTCHAVSRSATGWEVAPIRITTRWMPNAQFDHKAHAQSRCAQCHDVARSKRASDIAIPTIEKCRDCHAGARAAEGKVTSNCMLCHGFHDASHPWDPTLVPDSARRLAGGSLAR